MGTNFVLWIVLWRHFRWRERRKWLETYEDDFDQTACAAILIAYKIAVRRYWNTSKT